MVLNITNNTTIKSVQEAFSGQFPFLFLEFKVSNKRRANAKTIGDIHKLPESAFVVIQPETKPRVIEHVFRNLGLNVQVYWRHNTQWLEAEGKCMTLKELNDQGQNERHDNEYKVGTDHFLDKEY
jgi:hypothetical protein